METVNRVVESASKAVWGEQNGSSQSQATASNSQNQGLTGIESVDKVINTGKKAIWGETADDSQASISPGEEPVAGVRGLGTATDPYDAGNRDEQPGAPPVESGGLPTSIPVTEQRNIETMSSTTEKKGTDSAAALGAAVPNLKSTVTGLRPDLSPSEPSSRALADAGPGQALKHTSEPFEKEAQKLAADLKDVKVDDAPAPAAVAVEDHNQDAMKRPNSETKPPSSSKGSSSVSSRSRDEQQPEHKRKTSKLEKMKNKLHLGSHSPNASR